MSATAVVFDLGQVLVPAWDLQPVARSVGADPTGFATAYWAYRVAYDCGMAPEEYWTLVLRDCVPDGVVDPVHLARLTREDAERWVQLAPESHALLVDLRAAGVPLALLSNAPVALAEVARASDWAPLFDHLVFSGEVGVAKPDAEIYHVVRDLVGRPPAELVFFDDRPPNVDGALAVGWQAHVWDGVDAARAVLAELLGPASS